MSRTREYWYVIFGPQWFCIISDSIGQSWDHQLNRYQLHIMVERRCICWPHNHHGEGISRSITKYGKHHSMCIAYYTYYVWTLNIILNSASPNIAWELHMYTVFRWCLCVPLPSHIFSISQYPHMAPKTKDILPYEKEALIEIAVWLDAAIWHWEHAIAQGKPVDDAWYEQGISDDIVSALGQYSTYVSANYFIERSQWYLQWAWAQRSRCSKS
jgi:hypothetical protein